MAVWEVVPLTVQSGTEDEFESAFRSNIPSLQTPRAAST